MLLGKKAMTKLDSILKSRDITLSTKASLCIQDITLYSQSYGFSSSHVQVWEFDHKEGWAPNNGCFQIMVLKKTLESPFDCDKIKPVYTKEINSEYSLERLMLKLKLQYFGHLMQKAGSLQKTLTVGKMEGRRRRGWQKTRCSYGIID